MVAELRAKQADINSRRHFTKDGESIQDTREVIEDWLTPEPVIDPQQMIAASAANLRQAADSGFIEMG